MAVTDFDTKVAVVVRDDLAVWQKLNVTAFLISGVIADAGETVVGEDYLDGDGARYLPLLVQPVLVYAATRSRRPRPPCCAPRRRRRSARPQAPPRAIKEQTAR
jgi:Protein of unknown function (DUF2000)